MSKTFPKNRVNSARETLFCRLANKIVDQATNGLFPLLESFGMLDEPHVMKYLQADTYQVIFEDVSADPNSVQLFKLLKLQGINILERFQDKKWKYKNDQQYIAESDTDYMGRPCRIIRENPEKEWFSEWRPIPGADITGTDRDGQPLRKKVLSFISWKNGGLHIDFSKIRENSYYAPSKAQQKAYAIISDCIEGLAALGVSRRDVKDFFTWGRNGQVEPSILHIVTKIKK